MKKDVTDSSFSTEEAQSVTTLKLNAVTDREISTRRISSKHALALMESIAAVGLIQPIAVSKNGVLLAGGHRLEAIRMLREHDQDVFENLFPDGFIPVRVIDLEEGQDGDRRALEIELTENEKRRDYTGKEISELVTRLQQAGYKTTGAGPRKRGDKQKQHLTEALALILGKSRRQAQRLLSASAPPVKPTQTEATMARCLRAINQALIASSAGGNLEECTLALLEAVRLKSGELEYQCIRKAGASRAA